MVWKSILRSKVKPRQKRPASPNRRCLGEKLEPRKLMAADPIHVGLVYIETDYLEADQDAGNDSQGDRFILSFTGGADDTELREIRIDTDKDGDGLSVGDSIFDTAVGDRGKNGAHDFEVVRIEAGDGRTPTVNATVADGGQELVLRFTDFRAGDRIEFTMDVDEILRMTPDLALFNNRLDVITSGQEFQDSILRATFEAPHYETATATDVFLNDFGSPGAMYGLDLPPDEGPGVDSRPNRSAAAIGQTVQVAKPIEISGHVWADQNLNLQRESTEAPISGVGLELFRLNESTGEYASTGHRTITDASGAYQFPKALGLAPGTYRVVETQPDGFFSVGAVPGRVDGTPVGAAETDDVLAGIQIPLGDTSATNYDFAEASPASISGFVYRDDNNDGVRDPAEPGLGGIRVQLVPIDTIADQPPLSVTTAADGSYSFSGIAPGTYHVVELDQPADLADGKESAGTIDGRTVGTALSSLDRIESIALGGGDVGVEYNFGEVPLGSIGGFVYLVNPGETCTADHGPGLSTPLADVRVELWTDGGEFVIATTTDQNGAYLFDELPVGRYEVREITPAGLINGQSHVGRIATVTVGTAEADSIGEITLGAGADGREYNFCEASPAGVSGHVYHDRSDDGSRDSGEAGIAGVTIELIDASGNVIAETQTNALGFYEFQGLTPGTYTVRETQPAGYFDGIDTPGTVAGRGVGRVGADADSIESITLIQGLQGVEYNFGELQAAAISGHVHVDLDQDCVQDPGEADLGGVVIRLLDASGAEVARTVTDAGGDYRFDGLRPGLYTVVEETPDGFFEGGSRPGSGGGTTDGPNRIVDVLVESGEEATDNDFCERPPSRISGVVFNDRDQDCIQSSTEAGIANVVIELFDADGRLVATTMTDALGRYSFEGLPAGQYTVTEQQPAGFLQGGQVAGSHGGDASNPDRISAVDVGWGQDAVNYDFCEIEPSKIGGFVWQETDRNRVFDPGETPIPGVPIELLDAEGNVIATTVTDENGAYCFEGLPPGEYGVREIQPGGLFDGGQVPGTVGGQTPGDDVINRIIIRPGTTAAEYNFPEIPPARISGFVFQDGAALATGEAPDPATLREFRDGLLTPDDTPLPSVTLELRNVLGQPVDASRALDGAYPTGPIRTSTDASGFYQFDGLRPGTYHVYQIQPEDYVDSLDTPGTTGGLAINEADSASDSDKIVIQTLAADASTDPGVDAILNIDLQPGGSSESNNFSEIIVEPVPPRPIDPPELAQPAPLVIETFQRPVLLVAPFLRPDPVPEAPIIAEWGVSWHLSVINGGYPRGSIELPDLGVFRSVAASIDSAQSDDAGERAELNHGSWILSTLDGESSTLGEEIGLGRRFGTALAGDFNGDGRDDSVIYSEGYWFVDLNGNGRWDNGDLWIRLGTELDRPVVGDWDGDGKDDIGIFGRQWQLDPVRFRRDPGLPDPANQRRRLQGAEQPDTAEFAKHQNREERVLKRGNDGALRADAVDHVFLYGEHVDTPLAGDWNGDGIDQIGIFRGGQWMLDMNGDGRRTSEDGAAVDFGRPGDEPVAADFNGDGIDEIAVVRGDVWIIDTDGDGKLTGNDRQVEIPRPSETSQPVVGDFDGDGEVELGYYDDDAA